MENWKINEAVATALGWEFKIDHDPETYDRMFATLPNESSTLIDNRCPINVIETLQDRHDMPDWANNTDDAMSLVSDIRWSSDHRNDAKVYDDVWVYEVIVWNKTVPYIATAATLPLAICEAWLMSQGVALPD